MTLIAPVLLDAAAQAAGGQQYPAGALYVVATPIGNLADLSLRAIHVLALADTVACEDTRTSGSLLRHLGLNKPLLALHEHNETQAARRVGELLAQGQRVAYVSDAGTPAVSDPGAALVAAAAAAGHRVVPIPGASSVVAALSVSGDAGGSGFAFTGFLPARGRERESALQAALAHPGTQVLFEAPHRIAALLQALADAAPRRRVTLCRELTKQFETVVTLPAGDGPAWLAADANRARGEFVLVLHAPVPAAADGPPAGLDPATQRALHALLGAGLPLKQAVELTTAITQAPRNAVYAAALAARGAEGGDG